MPNPSRKSVLIDTSFLITLFDDSRTHHENAKKYYKFFINNKVDMYISAIVASEYSQKGSMDDIISTNNFIISPFNYGDGVVAGDFASALSREGRNTTDSRDAVKDDVKLLAQCSNNGMSYVATDDASTLAKYCRKLNELGKLETKVITMNTYDISAFNNGQMAFNID